MQNDVTDRVILISNKIEYLARQVIKTVKNSIKVGIVPAQTNCIKTTGNTNCIGY